MIASWVNIIQEDMRMLGKNEDLTSDRCGWREAINRLTPQSGNQRRYRNKQVVLNELYMHTNLEDESHPPFFS